MTIGIVTGLMGVGVLSLDRGFMNLTTARQNLVNDLRRARMQATLKGAHFRFEVSGTGYSITRLSDSDGDGQWEVDQQFNPKVVNLPTGYTVSSDAGSTAAAEFDGRGLLVPQPDGSLSIVSVTIAGNERSEALQIWPSGQVESTTNAGGTTSA